MARTRKNRLTTMQIRASTLDKRNDLYTAYCDLMIVRELKPTKAQFDATIYELGLKAFRQRMGGNK